MKTGLVILGALLAIGGAFGYSYVTVAAEDCNTTPGAVGSIADPNVRDQCRLAGLIIMAAIGLIVAGVVVALVGLLA